MFLYIAIKIIKDKGTIIRNFSFLILCLQIIIPRSVPRLPPKILNVSNVNSLIRCLFKIAKTLSNAIIVKEMMFKIIK